MKTLKYFNFQGKRVLLRCDFNVPFDEKGQISDDFRIKQSLPTIEYLKKKGAKIILISHLGRPKGKEKKYSLKPVSLRLEEKLEQKVKFLDDCLGKKVRKEIEKMKEKDIVLLENLRFYKEEEDYYPPSTLQSQPTRPKKENANFAKELSKLGDIYINDAFSCSHRPHASIVGLPKYLPSAAGLLLEKEIKVFSRVLEKPWRPLVAVIGGVKIETKIKVIEKFLKIADHLLLGSKIAEIILIAKGILVGRKFPEREILDRIKKINLTNPKLHLPTDGMMALASLEEKYSRIGAVGTLRKEEEIFDVGSETIKIFSEIIKEAKMIIWSGPLGMYEKEQFEKGTKEIAKSIARNYTAFKIIGGGDTISAIFKFGLGDKFDHVSTGGGAMLQFLSGEKFPGLDALE